MSLSLEFLERSAAETGFRVSALEKVARLGELAGDIGWHPFLGSVLILGKLLALLERGAARDVWDAAHLSDKAGGRLTADRFRKLFMALSVVLERPLPTYSRERLERQVTEQTFTEQVAPLLNVHVDFRVSDLIGRAWAVVGRFLDLSDDEKAYLESADHGDLRMELIFPDAPQEAERVAGHPAIQWKMANVRAHLAKVRGKN